MPTQGDPSKGAPVTRDEAIAAAGEALAAARQELHEVALQGGPEAVAAWACPNGTPRQQAAIAASYQQLSERAASGG